MQIRREKRLAMHLQAQPLKKGPPCATAILLAILAGFPATLAIFAPAPAAQAQDLKKVDEIRTRQQAKRALLKWKRERENQVKANVARITKDRERINARLLETARATQDSEGKLTKIEARLSELEAQEKILRGSLAQRHDVIAKLLAAMQRMGRNPPPVMITRRADALKMVRSAMLLAATFPELRQKALELAGKLQELTRVADASRDQAAKLKLENARLGDTRTRLSTLLAEKKQMLGSSQSELLTLRREAREIKKSVSGLGDLIARLDKAVAARTALGKYDTSQKMSLRAPPAGTTSLSKGSIISLPKGGATNLPKGRVKTASAPAPSLGRKSASPQSRNSGKSRASKSIVMAPGGDLAMISPGRLEPAIPFRRAKGRLPLPAHGRKVVSFGEKTQYGARSKGIVIQTRHSAQVISPTDGWVVYAGEFRSYGQLLIINAGEEYHILLAGLSQIDVQLGQFVLAGEPVGVMSAASRRLKSKSKGNAPVLYIEFRKKGRPINPRPWWVKGSKKV